METIKIINPIKTDELEYSPSAVNTTENDKTQDESESKNLLINDNSWKRLFYIKWKIFVRNFKLYYPMIYFMLISFAAQKVSSRLFIKFIQPKLEGNIN